MPVKAQKAADQDGSALGPIADSELIIGLVGAVGTDLASIVQCFRDQLKIANYATEEIDISKDVLSRLMEYGASDSGDEYKRITAMMAAGNQAREKYPDKLALGAIARINQKRANQPGFSPRDAKMSRQAFIIKSLKHPAEVIRLRNTYPQGFYLLGVYAGESTREEYLTKRKRMAPEQARELIKRDDGEIIANGQHVADTFHMSDFFVAYDGSTEKLERSIFRIFDILFGSPYLTPTFQEYAMYLAFSASLRSADLSRQVGAVITRDREVIATGANECPKFGGGLYWPEYNAAKSMVEDIPNGREHCRIKQTRREEQSKFIDDILKKVRVNLTAAQLMSLKEEMESSRMADIMEFGRSVHAEMDALISCARNGISTKDAVLYCTTFPCHNCAKHIVAAGIRKVVYIEPYPKSKAFELHDDSIEQATPSIDSQEPQGKSKVQFTPFIGVGPRRFFDLFSAKLGSGSELKRKNAEGDLINWDLGTANLRVQMLPASYLELEMLAVTRYSMLPIS